MKCDCGRWMTPILSGRYRWWCSPCMKGAEEVAKETKIKTPAERLAEDIKTGKVPSSRRLITFPGNVIAKEREKVGLRIAQVARATNVPESQIRDAEAGKDVHVSTALSLSGFYDKHPAELFGMYLITMEAEKALVENKKPSPPKVEDKPLAEESVEGATK